MRILRQLSLLVATVAALDACGNAETSSDPGAQSVQVGVQPSSTTLGFGQTLTLQAVVTGTANTAVTWSIVEQGSAVGTITSGGLYTAPGVAGTFHIRAVSAADPTVYGESTATVQAQAPATCTSFTYSSWSTCSNGRQTRTVLTSSPSGCTGGSPVLTQSCSAPIAGAPFLINTDIVAGSLTGGEGGLGAYMSLFGHGFGAQASTGTPSGVQVWFRNPSGDNAWHEVANYRALIQSRTYARNAVEQVIVQLGSLGGQANGAVLDLKVTVGGVDSNVLAGWFTVQPGRFFFASLSGNDSTGVVDDITHPFRYVQRYSSGYTGIWASTVPTGAAGLRAGDTIVIRGGTWTDYLSHDGQWIRFYSHNGSPPNGAVGHGYINFVRYPGPIMGHAPEDVFWQGPAAANGGIDGPESSRWHLCGQYVTISGLRLQANAGASMGPIDLQAGGDSWRIFDNDLSFPTTLHATNGGIAGTGHGDRISFNSIHDIGGDTSYLETHGIYIGDASLQSGTDISQDWDVSYNWLARMTGGSCLQWNATMSSSTFSGIQVHHNWIEHCAKNGLNASNNTGTGNAWYDNVILDVQGGQSGASLMVKDYQAGMVLDILHNTVVQYVSVSDGGIISTQASGFSSGRVAALHNVFAMGPGHASSLAAFDNLSGNGAAISVSQNLYFNFGSSGPTSRSSGDALGMYGNPLFAATPTSQTSDDGDYTLQPGSPAWNAASAANPVPVVDDLFGEPRPVPDTSTPGASRNALGAIE